MKKNFIDDNIEIDFPLPDGFEHIINMCEKYDSENNYGAYEAHVSFLTGSLCKNAYAAGKLTKEQWNKIGWRYLI